MYNCLKETLRSTRTNNRAPPATDMAGGRKGKPYRVLGVAEEDVELDTVALTAAAADHPLDAAAEADGFGRHARKKKASPEPAASFWVRWGALAVLFARFALFAAPRRRRPLGLRRAAPISFRGGRLCAPKTRAPCSPRRRVPVGAPARRQRANSARGPPRAAPRPTALEEWILARARADAAAWCIFLRPLPGRALRRVVRAP